MARKLARLIIVVFGMAVGPALLATFDQLAAGLNLMSLEKVLLPWAFLSVYILSGIATGIIFYFLSPKIIDGFAYVINKIEATLSEMPLADIFFGVLGLLTGLVIAFLLSTLTAQIPIQWLGIMFSAVFYIVFGYLGWSVATKRRSEVNMPTWFRKGGKDRLRQDGGACPKVLDTSVIIDGRILDICRTGIVEGVLIIPAFVLQELRHIADSSDALKRNRGRRGLDILSKMQKEIDLPIRIEDKDYDDIAEVDSKLLRLAHDLGGVVVTNDYNLNKVAAVQKVPVFNINELANAIKPVVLPGEETKAFIVKEGKESGQGIAYLDDGTMIVVEGGRRYVGSEMEVIVTSVLQTSAGRMIFAKIKAQ